MAHKIHLRANKPAEDKDNLARCASQATSIVGKIRRNSRRTYATIPQQNIVGFKEFRAAYEADPTSVCSHCIDTGLMALNRKRKQLGLVPVQSIFEGLGLNPLPA